MLFKKLFFAMFLLTAVIGYSQSRHGIVCGPLVGNIEIRNATICREVMPFVKKVAVRYIKTGNTTAGKTVDYKGELVVSV